PTTASINSNGAPVAQSKLEYQLNGGAWQDYSSAIIIASSDSIIARNKSLNLTSYSDSATTTETYYQLVSDFSGGGVGSWGNVQGGSNLVQATSNGDPTSSLTHGNTKLDLGGGNFLDAGVANELTFTKTDFTGAAPNTWFEFGSVSILNGTTFYDSESSGATLTVNLNLTQPASTGVVHVDLGFISTENNGNSLENADIVELKSPSTNFTTTIGGVTYRLELSWVSLDPGSGVVQGNQFMIYEGATASAQLRARFVSDH
ncbi:MAG: choice-of-anchor K domain-containing protein, partial [Burkholderiales bacterium]